MTTFRVFHCNTVNVSILLVITILSFAFHYYDFLLALKFDAESSRNRSNNDLNDISVAERDLSFLINPINICGNCNENFLLLITIVTPVNNTEQRNKIRHIWGKSTKCTKVVFITGISHMREMNYQIQAENIHNNDIIQGGFSDVAYNMTFKHVMGLKWVSKYCQEAKFVVKLDEVFVLFLLESDVVVDLVKMRFFLKRVMLEQEGIACKVLRKGFITDLKKSRHVNGTTAVIMHPADNLPYCWGGIIIYSAEVVRRLVAELSKPHSTVGDMSITDVLAQRAGVKYLNFEPHFFLKLQEEWLIEIFD